jgi:uncharacterized protein YyaL (SSP411 family)
MMMNGHTREAFSALALTIVVAVAPGCGGGENGPSDPDGQPQTKTLATETSAASTEEPSAAREMEGGGTTTEPNASHPSTGDDMTTPPVDIESRNRLADATSPYLLQHKDNPVHWWQWGEEAFAAARALDRPIFLSVGYSTCYWCHVMERESFENEAIAAIMNERFICIKLDREERPDVDAIYMVAVQALNQGQGGWPMSVFLEPENLKPFLAGTYFPPEGKLGRPGFPDVLNQVADLWKDRRSDVLRQAEQVASLVERQLSQPPSTTDVDSRDIERAVSQVLATYDRQHGGFGGAPKFPVPSTIDFLMEAGWDLSSVRKAVTHTLDRMAMGGMYDQVGGGFHRYSTDAQWLVPHFEKMLYDNGQLAVTYARAYELTQDPYYAEVLRETLDYVLREMSDPAGGFFSAQDAEVNHREGLSYLWTADQVREVLTSAGLGDQVEFALEIYGLAAGTNFQDPHHPEDEPKNVLFLARKPADLAEQMQMPLGEFNERLERINAALLAARSTREQPNTDDKVLAGWNGLMIAGFAEGARVLGESKYRDAARRAADFVLARMRAPDGGLLRTYRDGEASIDAFLEDYAFMIHGLLALHRAAADPTLLSHALELTRLANERFRDDVNGGYFDTLPDQSDLFVRVKTLHDGAEPSGNSVMMMNLLRLHELNGDQSYLDDAIATMRAMSGVMKQSPTASTYAWLAAQHLVKEYPDELGGAAAASSSTTSGGFGERKVTVAVSERVIRLGPDESATFDVTINVPQGLHVNSNRPGIEYLIPLELKVVGGEGIELTPRYPDGESYSGPEGAMNVYHGTVTIPVTVLRIGAITGRPRVVVTYQACTSEMCFSPENEPLPLRIIGR